MLNKNKLIITFFCCMMSGHTSVAYPQDSKPLDILSNNSSSIFQDINKEIEDLDNQPEAIQIDPSVIEAYKNNIIWEFEFYHWSYCWHLISTIIIFSIVHALVLSGLYFSYLQFKQSVNIAKQPKKDKLEINKKDKDNEKSELAIPESKIVLGFNKIEINSSIIGLLILTISLAFFYLYINNVYPLRVLENSSSQTNDPSNDSE